MSPLSKVLQVGATWSPGPGHANLGPVVLRALLAEPSFDVSVLVRNSSNGSLPPGLDVKVERIADDYPDSELISAFQGFDAVVLTTGFATLNMETRFVDAAAAAGVKRIILPNWGAPGSNARVAAASPLFAAKADTINYAKTKESSGLTWTAIACGIFFDMVLMPIVSFDIEQRTGTAWDGGNRKWSTSTKEQAARAAIQVLKKPEKSQNRLVYVSSFETSHNAILDTLEHKTASKWSRVDTTTDRVIKDAKEAIKAGDVAGGMRLALLPYFAEGFDADYAAAGLLDNDELELAHEEMEVVIESALSG